MATVKGPLMSIEASGKFAQTLVFDRRGYARQYVIPRNPRTEAQQTTRLHLKSIQHALGFLNPKTIKTLQETAPTSYRWNAWIVGKIMDTFATDINAFAEMPAEDKAPWANAATTIGMTVQSVPEIAPSITVGALMYAVSKALHAATKLPNALTAAYAKTELFD